MEQFPFMMLVPIKTGQERILEEILSEMGKDVRGVRLEDRQHKVHIDFSKSPSTHFARFVVLEHPDAGPQRKRLLFSSNYDGNLEGYLNELDTLSTDEVHEGIWSRLEGYPGKEGFKDFLRRENKRYPVDTFFVGARGETVEKIRAYQDARAKFDNMPDQPHWLSHDTQPPKLQTRLYYRWRGIVAVLRILPFLLRYSAATYKTILTFDRTGMLLNPVSNGYSRTIQNHLHANVPCLNDAAPPTAVSRPPLVDVVGEDVIGQNQMTVITDVIPDRLTQLKTFLKLANAGAKGITPDGSLYGISTIHFARWVLIDDDRRLLFLSNYDGSWDSYIGDFTDKGYKGLDAAWMSSYGYPGSRDIEAFKQMIRCRQVQSHYFYSAYPSETIKNILSNRAMLGNM